jgi:hypothetical protein
MQFILPGQPFPHHLADGRKVLYRQSGKEIDTAGFTATHRPGIMYNSHPLYMRP